MTTYAVNGRPTVVDDFASASVAVQNTGTVPLYIEPLGRTVGVGATVTVPGWSTRATSIRTAGQAGSAVVTLTAGSPAAAPGPGGVTFDPGQAVSMSVSISGGTWYTNEGLTAAAIFPVTVTSPTVLYPSSPASVVITATVGTTSQARGMNVTEGSAEAFTWTPSTDAERAAAGASAGSGSFVQVAGDVGGTPGAPQVVATHLAAPLPVAQGGTASATAGGARTALGLGTAAVQDATAFDVAGLATAALAAAVAASAQRSANLSDLASPSSARTALGLGSAATMTPTSLAADSAFTGPFLQAAETRGTNSAVAVYYVDPTRGSDSNDGLSWKKPLATIQAAINLANTAIQAATIVVSNDRHDVGTGLVITKGQPITITGTLKRAQKYGSPSVFTAVPAGCGPVLYSSTGANPLVSYTGNGVAQGGAFQSICFECTGAAQQNAIVALGVNHVQVDDCLFFFTATTPAAATAIWAYNLNLPAGSGDDTSWWRITNNVVSKAGLVKFGSSSSDLLAVDADANQNVVRDNFGNGRRVNPGDVVAPFVEVNRGHRTAIRDNNVERYTTGILFRGCFQCSESGDGGERTQQFIRLVNTRSTDLAPIGSSNAGNIGAGVSAVSSIAAAGSGYAVNDTITLTGGTFSTAAVLTVTAVSGGGVTAASVTTAGSYSVNPSNPVAQGSTSGVGTGATFNVTFAGAPAVLVSFESTSTSNAVRTPATTSTDVLYGTTAGAFSVDGTSPLSAQTIITTDATSKPAYRVFPKSAVRSNQWGYAPEVGALATSALANGQMKYVPLGVDRAATIITIGIEVTAAGASGSTIRLGIYADDGAGFPTGLPILDAGTIDSTSTGFKSITGLTLAVQRGLYWLACAGQASSGTTPQVRCIGGIASGVVPLAGPVGGTNCSGYQDAGTITGAFTTANPTSNATGPIIAVRYQ